MAILWAIGFTVGGVMYLIARKRKPEDKISQFFFILNIIVWTMAVVKYLGGVL